MSSPTATAGAIAGAIGGMAAGILSDGAAVWLHSQHIKAAADQCTFANQDLYAASDLPVDAALATAISSMELLNTSLQTVLLHGSELVLKADEAFAGTDAALSQDMLAPFMLG